MAMVAPATLATKAIPALCERSVPNYCVGLRVRCSLLSQLYIHTYMRMKTKSFPSFFNCTAEENFDSFMFRSCFPFCFELQRTKVAQRASRKFGSVWCFDLFSGNGHNSGHGQAQRGKSICFNWELFIGDGCVRMSEGGSDIVRT